jgi:hypothetical protein
MSLLCFFLFATSPLKKATVAIVVAFFCGGVAIALAFFFSAT